METVYPELKKDLEKEGWELKHLKEQIGGNEFVVWDSYLPLIIPPMHSGDPGNDEILLPPQYGRHEVDWSITYLSQYGSKLLYWEPRIPDLWKSAIENPDQKIIILWERGPMEWLVWCYALYSHQGDSRFTIPEETREERSFWIPQLAIIYCLSNYFDAAVFAGLSQKEAIARRKRAGKTHEGLTETPFFRTLSYWFDYWVKNIWPTLHEVKGTGLLVLNGEAKIEENAKRLTTYIKRMTEKLSF